MYRVNIAGDNPMANGLFVKASVPSGHGHMWVYSIGSKKLEQTFVTGCEDGPTLFLPHELARPLTDVLVAYYGVAGGVRELRRDYEAERLRVNKLIDALIGTIRS